jgi:hypothetical protein
MATATLPVGREIAEAKQKAIEVARRHAYTRPQNKALTIEEAKACSDLAYKGKVDEPTSDRKWCITRDGVFDTWITGFRAVLLKAASAQDRRMILAFAGTDSSFESIRSTLDVLLDAGTDIYQALNFNPLAIPDQYNQAATLAEKIQRTYGDQLRVTGHSLGGGLASFVSLKFDIPGAGINAAPLGVGTLLHLLMFGKRKPSRFTHYDNNGEIVSSYAPGVQVGEVCQVQTNAGAIDAHLLENVNTNAPMFCYDRFTAAGTGATGSW